MVQIKQLNSRKAKYITYEQQKLVIGGGAGNHSLPKRYMSFKTSEELWSGYADGEYYIDAGFKTIDFFRSNGGAKIGAITAEGASLRVKNPGYDHD